MLKLLDMKPKPISNAQEIAEIARQELVDLAKIDGGVKMKEMLVYVSS